MNASLEPNLTKRLKQTLWERFGTAEHPAEWDGRVYGGGKLSQRYWEYMEAVRLLELTPESVVLDIGGGSPATGAGFFASLLATEIKRVVIIDPNIAPDAVAPPNIEFVRREASEAELTAVFRQFPDITHVASISVFEHIEPSLREAMVRAINDAFSGETFVATFEYHARAMLMEHQLTARTTHELFRSLTNFYPDEMHASPVWSENGYDSSRTIKFSRLGPVGRSHVPLWYPVAVRFVRKAARG